MAFTIPETIPSHDSRVMPGERKVFVALRDHLPRIGSSTTTSRWTAAPDFIILGPDLGLVN
jgi:hypothetical protein